MKVISNKELQKAGRLGKVQVPKQPAKTTGHDASSDQITILKQLKVSIDAWLNELETGSKSIQEGIRNVDQSIRAIDIPAQAKPITNLTVYDIERDMGGNMTGFQIKAIRGG